MSGALFLLSWLAIPVFGLPVASRFARGNSRAAGFAFGFGSGAVVLTLAMLALAAAGIPWSLPRIALTASPVLLLFLVRPPGRTSGRRIDRRAFPAIAAAAAALLVFVYATATARATSMDYLYFWGTKGQEFAAARGIDAAFLAEPDHVLLHPDYPPLLPFLDAWGAMAAGRFPWGAGLLSAPIFLGLALAAFWGTARSSFGDRAAAARTAFLAALLGLTFVASDVAGNAEPPLLFFETLALGILVFGDRSPRNDVAASIALAGCTLTKFEGSVFVAAAVGAFVVFERRGAGRLSAAFRLSMLPLVALGGWLAFCARHGLLDNYKGGLRAGLALANLPNVVSGLVRSASYGVAFLPWLALLALGAASRPGRAALAPAAVAAAFVLANVGFYLHGRAELTNWIAWSGSRVLLTPLLCVFFAAAGSGAPPEPAG